MQRKWSLLVPASSILILGTLASTAGSVRPAAEQGLAQSLTGGPIHLPVVARSAPLVGAPIESDPWIPDADFVIGGPAMAVAVVGDVAFAGIGAHLVALDLAAEGDTGARVLGASPPLPGFVADIEIIDGLAYVAVAQMALIDVHGGLFVLDVRDPRDITVIGSGPIAGGADHLVLEGSDALLLSARQNTLGKLRGAFHGATRFDISNPRRPVLRAQQSPEYLSSPFLRGAIIGDSAMYCSEMVQILDLNTLDVIDFDDDLLHDVGADACDAVASFDGHLVIISGAAAWLGFEYPPTLHVVNMSDRNRPAPLASVELPLESMTSIDVYARIHGITRIADSIVITGSYQSAESFAIVVDLSSVDVPVIAEHHNIQFGAMDVAGDDRRLVVAGALVDAADANEFAHAVGLSDHFMFGSTVAVIEREETSGRPRKLYEGPGTRLFGLATTDGPSAFLLESRQPLYEIDFPNRRGRLWRIELDSSFPRAVGYENVDDIRGLDDSRSKRGPRIVATSDALMLARREDTRIFDLRGEGAPSPSTSIRAHGSMATSGHTLFVAYRSGVALFDVAEPTRPIELGSVDLRSSFVNSIAAASGWLWAGDDASKIVHLIDVRNPMEPIVVDSIELDEPAIGLAAEGDFAVATTSVSVYSLMASERSMSAEIADMVVLDSHIGMPSHDIAFAHPSAWMELRRDDGLWWLQLDIEDPRAIELADRRAFPSGASSRTFIYRLEQGGQVERSGHRLLAADNGAGFIGLSVVEP